MDIEDRRLIEVRDALLLAEQARESSHLCGDLEIVAGDDEPTADLLQRLRELEAPPAGPLSEGHSSRDRADREGSDAASTTEHRR